MIKEITENIGNIIDNLFLRMAEIDYTAFILFIGRADIQAGLKDICGSDCVIDYMGDIYMDETREGFYLRYLNRNYKRDGFSYGSPDGIDDLSIELMIYSHLWESDDFLKALVRIAGILSGNGYIWSPTIPEEGKWRFMQEQVIAPIEPVFPELAQLLKDTYSSDLRNAFAHALYNVDVECRAIYTYTRRGMHRLSFDEFQQKFLNSVILMNFLHNAASINHNRYASMECTHTEPFFTPDGVKVQIRSQILNRGNDCFPEFRIVKIIE